MGRAEDIAIQRWADSIVNESRRIARGTNMARGMVADVRNGLVIWQVADYGYYQNQGVAGVDKSNIAIGKATRDAMRLGISSKKFKYTEAGGPPPSKAFARYTSDKTAQYLIARSIWRIGFPSGGSVAGQVTRLNWLNTSFRKGVKRLDTTLAEELIQIWNFKVLAKVPESDLT